MRSCFARLITTTVKSLVVLSVLLCPINGFAQEGTVSGTVVDGTGAVLPGVTITARQDASGNTLTTTTDERGAYRLPVRTGVYRITAELQGFAEAARSVELLLGQQAIVDLKMAPASVQETVTVTGEAPLLDVTQSKLSGNIDPRQVSELPVNGRDWIDLTMLARGSRTNAVAEQPTNAGGNSVGFQINVDGQQVTMTISTIGSGQPHFSKDAIAEFEFVSNRFDASQGRSNGVQVNAITKSGTNRNAGSFSGYFRDDTLNARDFIQKRVLPYSDQQWSGTFGGPIRRDRVHFFVNYEFERQPQTLTHATPYSKFNFDLNGTNLEHKRGARVDFQRGQGHLTARYSNHLSKLPFDPRYSGGSSLTPSSAEGINRNSNEAIVSYTTVLSARTVNEMKGGVSNFYWDQYNYAKGNPYYRDFGGRSAPRISLRGLTVGQTHTNSPGTVGQRYYSVRDDFSYNFTKAGNHTLKIGGEYLNFLSYFGFVSNQIGTLDATGLPIPANIESFFPDMMDASTWNYAALSPMARQFTIGIGSGRRAEVLPKAYATWIQDDWTVSRGLTLNLGLRFDLQDGVLGEHTEVLPFAPRRPLDKNNYQPRVGFVYTLDDRTLVRGGAGRFSGAITDNATIGFVGNNTFRSLIVLNDGRPDFAANPFNGPVPTYAQAVATAAVRNLASVFHPDSQVPYSYQGSFGLQRQLGSTSVIEADYVYTGTRHDSGSVNANLTFDPATGTNYPFATVSRRAYPEYGNISVLLTEGRSNYHALETAFTKRLSNHWQGSATYTLSQLKDADLPAYSGLHRVPFAVPKDLGGDYGPAVTDQRHRAVFNGIWQLPSSFQLSGLYFFGSGQRFATNVGTDRRNTGASSGRLNADGTILPRNNFIGNRLHRVDMRIQRGFRLGGTTRLDGVLEVFNLFNHENYGAYVTSTAALNYGAPSAVPNASFYPRTAQLGFRLVF